MPEDQGLTYSFASLALDPDAFTVVRFTGQEGLSQLFLFQITLISSEDSLDLEDVLSAPATLTMHSQSGDIPIHGILESLHQMQKVDQYTFYQAVLRPKLWWLTQTCHNQIFLNKTLPQFLQAVLQDGGLSPGLDFQLKLSKDYTEWEYVCQYQQSHFDFFSFWLERNGIYYYFDHTSGTDKVIITDTLMAHEPMPQGRTFSYYQPSSLEAPHREEVINGFVCTQRPLPAQVLLKDYNSQRPDLDMEASATVSPKGRGQMYLYGEHFRSLQEGRDLANIRAEEQICRQKLFSGESTVPIIRPGYTFTLDRHYREDMNTDYLNIEARHEGNQEAYLYSGLGLPVDTPSGSVAYRNSFTAIPASVQFRPERVTEKPRIHGSMHAKIDAAGSGKYAELDEQGRYKVVLPLDRSGRKDGKASCWLRMATPYAGSNHGMHCPLHKGTEVLLTFIDGNPDRPIIQSAVPNPQTPSVVRDTNQTQIRLHSSGGNVLHMEDEEDKKRILMHSPTAGSFIRVGYRNDPDDNGDDNGDDHGDEEHTKDVDDPQGDCMHDNTEGIRANTEKTLTLESGDFCTIVHGDEFGRVNGEKRHIIDGAVTEFVGGFKTDMVGGNVFDGVLGGVEEVVLDLKLALALSGVMEVTGPFQGEFGYGWKWTFHEAKEKFVAEENTLEGVKSHLQGEVDKLIADRKDLVGNVSKLAGASERLAAEVTEMAGANALLADAVEETCADKTSMAAVVSKAMGEALDCIGEKTQAIGEVMQSAGDKTQLIGIKETI